VLASLPRPSLPAPTTLAVVSDPHLAPDARGTWKVLHRAPGRFRAALADADRRGVDDLLLAAATGLPPSAYRLDAEGRRPGRADVDGGAP
jgi:hypothetical protein